MLAYNCDYITNRGHVSETDCTLFYGMQRHIARRSIMFWRFTDRKIYVYPV